jgi:DNA polymerase-1
VTTPNRTARNYGSITDVAEWRALADKLLADGKTVGFDVETGYDGPDFPKRALDPELNFIVGFSITNDKSWARYVPVNHDMAINMPEEEAFAILKEVLETLPVVAHGAKFEIRCLAAHDIVPNIISDTMIEAFVLSETKLVNLKFLTKETFGYEQPAIDSLFPHLTSNQRNCLRFNRLEVTPEVVAYACEDAAWCLAHHQVRHERCQKERGFIYKLEMQNMWIAAGIEQQGTYIEWDMLRKWDRQAGVPRKNQQAYGFCKKLTDEILAELSAMVGTTIAINLRSSAQLKEVLYDKLGMKTTRQTKSGKPSTDKVAMAALAKKHPVVQRIIELRSLESRTKRYFQKWPDEYSHAPDGKVHPNYKQCVVGTGRWAVDNPPLQQCPKKFHYELNTGEKFEGIFRDAIYAPDDWYILDFDYSQVELRVMAGLSQEPALIEAFNTDKDVHTITAGMMLGIPAEEITPEQRAVGKTMNFALLYGMGVNSLSDRLAIPKAQASELYNAYFSGFAAITAWMEKMKYEGVRRGYAETLFGRKYTIWELQSDNRAIYSKGERVCVNAPVQGTAADYMKVAMYRATKKIKELGWQDQVILFMNNHDALTFRVRADLDPREVIKALRPSVEFPVEGLPKIVSEWEFGKRWGSMVVIAEETVLHRTESGWELGETPRVAEDEDPFAVEDEDDEEVAENFPAAELPWGEVKGLAVPTRAAVRELSDPGASAEGPQPPNVDGNVLEDSVDSVRQLQLAQEADLSTLPQVGKTVIVSLGDMPTEPQFRRFMSLMVQRPGANMLTIRTPEGDLDATGGGTPTSLGPDDQPAISMIFGGAEVRYSADSVDMDALAAELAV